MKRLCLLLFFVVAFVASGCVRPFVKTQPGLDLAESQARETLMVTMGVHYQDNAGDENQRRGAVKAVMELANNKELGVVGMETKDRLTKLLAEEGFVLTTDDFRSKQYAFDPVAQNDALNTLAGFWFHPEGATRPFNTMLFDANLVEVAQRVRTPDKPEEYFSSIDVTISEGISFGCGGLIGWYYPIVTIRIRIIDNRGVEVYRARYIGEGDRSFGVSDRKPTNMRRAVERALSVRPEIEVEDL